MVRYAMHNARHAQEGTEVTERQRILIVDDS